MLKKKKNSSLEAAPQPIANDLFIWVLTFAVGAVLIAVIALI
jgi:hypothetical protein